MPAKAPVPATGDLADKIVLLGRQIRAQRKALGVSVVSAAQAAGMSRVTWHRIEKGAPSVTAGAYFNALAVLGLDFDIGAPAAGTADGRVAEREGWIPVRIRLDEYPQLRKLAWQVHGTDDLSPLEALGIYERNWRHLDPESMEPHEQHLVDALRQAFDRKESGV